MKYILLILGLFFCSNAFAQFKVYTQAEITQALLGTRSIKLPSYSNKNIGVSEALKGLEIDTLKDALDLLYAPLDSTWITPLGSYPNTNNLDSTILRRGTIVIQDTVYTGAGTEVSATLDLRYGDDTTGIKFEHHHNTAGLYRHIMWWGQTMTSAGSIPVGDTTTGYIWKDYSPGSLNSFKIGRYTQLEGDQELEFKFGRTNLQASGTQEISLMVAGNDQILVHDSTNIDLTGVSTDTFIMVGDYTGHAFWRARAPLQAAYFTLNPYGLATNVSGVATIPEFFMVPDYLNNKYVRNVSYRFFDEGVGIGSTNWEVVKRDVGGGEVILQTASVPENIISGDVDITVLVGLHDMIYFRLTGDGIVTDPIGLAITVTIW